MSDESSRKGALSDITRLINEARSGSGSALGALLSAFQPYLLVIAKEKLDPKLIGKVSPSDVVQIVALRAQRGFPRFRGQCRNEVQVWLLRILRRCLIDARRYYLRSEKRSVEKERSLTEFEAKSLLDRAALRAGDSVRKRVERRETAELARRALERLSARDRELIELRNRDDLSFGEIGERTGRSEDAARMAWTRAMRRLKKLLDEQP